ncbi:MAG: DUF3841 domain-containing protein [Clostridia bacterium]|nr:DUF3841 domain-containing protein [Clostridia bacterium]
MGKMKVRTKQHISVLEEIRRTGRYVVDPKHAAADYEGFREMALQVYDWLAGNCTIADKKPADAVYPVWVSVTDETVQPREKDYVIFELEADESDVCLVNIGKWGMMLNFSYIPRDEADDKRHKKLLEDCGVSDAKAFMSRFYPEIKAEITESWHRLFDESILPVNSDCYGIIWEIREERILNIHGL